MLDFYTVPLEFCASQQELFSPIQHSPFDAGENCFLVNELYREQGRVNFALLNQ